MVAIAYERHCGAFDLQATPMIGKSFKLKQDRAIHDSESSVSLTHLNLNAFLE